MATGCEFQQEKPEKDIPVLQRYLRGLGNAYLLGLFFAFRKERDCVGGCHLPIHFKHWYCFIKVQLFLQL